MQRTVWFTLSQDPVATYSLPCDIHLWPVVLQAAAKFTKLEKNQQNKVLEHVKESGFKPLFPTAVEEFSPE